MPTKKVEEYIRANNLFAKNDLLLLAISGGIDSVALLHMLAQLGYQMILAHCNFKLRGAESEEDERFVRQEAGSLNIPVMVRCFDTISYARDNKVSIQVAAREQRYQWFNELLDQTFPFLSGEKKPSVIVTAHHADDNVETVIFNFFRGAGIHGIRGILPKQGKIVRPLLDIRKEEIRNYCTAKQLHWREDQSNQDVKYTRNFIRNQLIPLAETIIPSLKDNIINSTKRFLEIEHIYNRSMHKICVGLQEKKGEELHIPVLKLLKQEALQSVVYTLFKPFGFGTAQIPEIISLLHADTGRYLVSSTHRVLRNRKWLIISPVFLTTIQHIVVGEEESAVSWEAGSIQLQRIVASTLSIENNSQIALLDAKKIRFPLLIRKWKAGDYFYPLGMQKKKKLSRFFIDRKLAISEKEKVWIIESNKKIIWIIGQRIDDRFKLSANSTEVLKIIWTSSSQV